MAPDASHPGGAGPGRGHPQDRPSLRLRMAAVLLPSGEAPQRVAERTRVPRALIDLLAEEISITGATSATQADVQPATVVATEVDHAAIHPPTSAATGAAEAYLVGARARWGRRRVLGFRLGLVTVAVNLVTSIVADLGHHYMLAVVSVILAPALVLGLIWSVTRRPRPPA